METRLGNSLLNDLKKDSSVIDYKMKSEIESVLLEKPKKNPSKNQLRQPKKENSNRSKKSLYLPKKYADYQKKF